MKRLSLRITAASLLLFTCLFGIHAQEGYRSPGQVKQWLEDIVKSHTGNTLLTELATSPGNRPVYLLEIGNETGHSEKSLPSVFVGANFDGNSPLATEGAIRLAQLILDEPGHCDSLNWYIIPIGNPDAAARYFREPLFEDTRNDMPVNDDRDEFTDEDGPDDLNHDGIITYMRVKHPEGPWIISEKDPRLMRKADPQKGETGQFKLFTEGIDDDGDGSYNEDGPGGVNVNLNFPFLFRYFTEPAGLYPGSTPESFSVMKFVFEHPDIAMIFSLGRTNFCMGPPKGGRKGGPDLDHLRVPARQARRFGLDPSRTYTLQELVDIFRNLYPGEQIDESMISGMLGLGAEVNPQEGDLAYYKKLASGYGEFLQEKGVSLSRYGPIPAEEGSMELWGYFHVGVPVFSMDLWGIPKTNSEGVKPDQENPGHKEVHSGEDGLENELAMLTWSDSIGDESVFVDWEPYEHPSLGAVEIGGFRPYSLHTPPFAMADSLMNLQLPWIFELAGELPNLSIYETKVTPLGKGTYRLDAWVENHSLIPFPTYMGQRNHQPAPAVLVLKGKDLELLSGYRRTPIGSLNGHMRTKVTWVLAGDPSEITLYLESKNAGRDRKTINIGG